MFCQQRYGLSPFSDIQLLINSFKVAFYGVLSDIQDRRYFLVGFTSFNPLDDFKLPLGEG